MNAQEFKATYMSEEDYWEGLTPCKLAYEGDEEVSHKTVYQTSVYRLHDQYFEGTELEDYKEVV